MSTLQAITYRGRTVAAASPTRFFLSDHLARLPGDHPDVVFVTYMCRCAADILTGRLPGPYTDDKARAYARGALIAPEHLERSAPAGDARLAQGLGVPLAELQAARSELVYQRAQRSR